MTDQIRKLFSKSTADWFFHTFGNATKVQEEAWPAIAAGKPVLVSAPTGTGKTLSAFLIFIDQLNTLAREGMLKQELYLLYISPLKSLAGDIRENLRRPLDGIPREKGQPEIEVAIRTGDTPQKERQRIAKHPPHILITTPESLYLMLTAKSGREVLKTARCVIIDELHALIDTKRGAHLMLSIARLDHLCGKNLQRIGLSATIEPLELSARYLSPEPAVIAAPPMEKKIRIEIVGTVPYGEKRKDPVWEELAKVVYEQCQGRQSVIAFSEGRRYAEKLAYYVNLLGGEGFAKVHHGSLSKEQRAEAELALRAGELRLLCATSSMELGIDVGEIDEVLQIGCPRTVSSTMQRLGRAGHNPGKVSVMHMYPRTAPESIYCGMIAELARHGGVEETKPPRHCLDILAQHLVSMAASHDYLVRDIPKMLKRAYPFRDVTEEDVKAVLRMLAGDYEHKREIPVRARVLYDRIHGTVMGDPYSRMLAVAAGGTIPDKGLYTAKTEDGIKVGELDEEFVYESQLGDRFLLGAFAWKIVGQDKDTVYVTQAPVEGARLPFWKGEKKGGSLRTSLEFGRIMGKLETAAEEGTLQKELELLGLDATAAETAADFLERQIQSTGGLPNDRTILLEHFTDHTGSHQLMVHALLGKRVNAPLSLLMKHAVYQICGLNVGCVDEEDGFLLYPYGDESLPDGLLFKVDPEKVKTTLEALLPETPIFSMTFRYNAARALMMGMKQNGRQPLWMQRLRSTELLNASIGEPEHPLIRETKRECLEDQWDIDGVIEILNQIRCGRIAVREVYVELPSPMSLPFRWQAEAAEMYEYSPTTPGIRQAVYDELKEMEKLKPSPDLLAKQTEGRRLLEQEDQLHVLLMTEGDVTAAELVADLGVSRTGEANKEKTECTQGAPIPPEWLESLAEREMAVYLEPGIWIAAEHQEEYENALLQENEEAGAHIVRRMLYYRGGQTAEEITKRYFFCPTFTDSILERLLGLGEIAEDEDIFYHAKRYDRARKETIRNLRLQTVTEPPEHYAALMAHVIQRSASSEEQLRQVVEQYCYCSYPVPFWEGILFRRRVKNYSETMLNQLLSQGDYFWKLLPNGNLQFCRYDDINWDEPLAVDERELTEDEHMICQELKKRGASFMKFLSELPVTDSVQSVLLKMAEQCLVHADSFVPVRQWQNREKLKKATARNRVGARVMALSAGRWELTRPVRRINMEELLNQCLREFAILCKETFQRTAAVFDDVDCFGEIKACEERSWRRALEMLRLWEYTGKVRRGYFVEGMSGAQFIRSEDYAGITAALKVSEDRIVWLNAVDPSQVWGKLLKIPEDRKFQILPGTMVALRAGRIAAVVERQGKALRIFERDCAGSLLAEFVKDFRGNRFFPDKKRLILKEYARELEKELKQAGFLKEMQDFVLYRS